jgi:hypothetical protein
VTMGVNMVGRWWSWTVTRVLVVSAVGAATLDLQSEFTEQRRGSGTNEKKYEISNASRANPTVTTTGGTVWGASLPASAGGVVVNQFLGIPFATAPRYVCM